MPFAEPDQRSVFDAAGRRKYVVVAERLRFLAAADGCRPEVRALCYVYAYTGCRVSEALQLHRHQIDQDACALTFRTLKRRRLVWRSVPAPEALIRMLLALPAHDDGLIWHAHRTTAWRWVKNALHAAQVAPGPHQCPKGFRHGLGVLAANSAVPLPLIQRWLGHSSPTTTAIYLDIVGDEEKMIYNRVFCIDK